MPRSRSFVLSLAVALSSPAFVSSQQLAARDFLIPGSQNLVVIDFVAARKLGVWDDLEASVLNAAFASIEKEIGFPLAALDRFQVCAAMTEGGSSVDTKQVLIWEGNRELGMHESYSGPSWSAERIGEFAVRRRESGRGDELIVQVRPELLVSGTAAVVQPVLEGKHEPAPMSPDVQSLLSGRERRIAWLVMMLDNQMMRQRFLGQVIGTELSAWPEDDLPTHLSAQVLVTGDEDDPHLEVRAVLRHVKEGQGVVASQKAVDGFVARLRDDERMRLIHPLLRKAAAVADHGDVVLQVDFGRSRNAIGNLATLLLPVIGRSGDTEQAQKKAPVDGRK